MEPLCKPAIHIHPVLCLWEKQLNRITTLYQTARKLPLTCSVGTSRCASHTDPNDELASAWKPALISSLSKIVRELRYLPYTKASNSVHQLPG